MGRRASQLLLAQKISLMAHYYQQKDQITIWLLGKVIAQNPVYFVAK